MKHGPTDWLLLAISTSAGAIAQIALKRALTDMDLTDVAHSRWRVASSLLTNAAFWLYGTTAIVSLATWWLVLRRFQLGFAYPVVQSLGFVLVLIASAWLFSESLTISRLAGIVLISAGLFLCR